jgi:hypothetical protein
MSTREVRLGGGTSSAVGEGMLKDSVMVMKP